MWLSRSGDDPGDQMNELKQKLKSELRTLLVEQHDQIKKKKEQHNTEVQTQTLWLYGVANDWQSWWGVPKLHCQNSSRAEPHHKDSSSAIRECFCWTIKEICRFCFRNHYKNHPHSTHSVNLLANILKKHMNLSNQNWLAWRVVLAYAKQSHSDLSFCFTVYNINNNNNSNHYYYCFMNSCLISAILSILISQLLLFFY